MKRFFFSAPAGLTLVALTFAAVVVYNSWSYCCGRCSLEDFLIPSPGGLALMAANGGALIALVILRRRPARGWRHCQCGASLNGQWSFCPDCGHPVEGENLR